MVLARGYFAKGCLAAQMCSSGRVEACGGASAEPSCKHSSLLSTQSDVQIWRSAQDMRSDYFSSAQLFTSQRSVQYAVQRSQWLRLDWKEYCSYEDGVLLEAQDLFSLKAQRSIARHSNYTPEAALYPHLAADRRKNVQPELCLDLQCALGVCP